MSGSILLVEDDDALAGVYEQALSKEGLMVEIASNPKQAIEKVKQNQPQLILLDVILGNENGFQLLKSLRRERASLDIPVIIITNLLTNEVGMQEELRASLGVLGVYTKSQLSLQKLVEVVRAVVKS